MTRPTALEKFDTIKRHGGGNRSVAASTDPLIGKRVEIVATYRAERIRFDNSASDKTNHSDSSVSRQPITIIADAAWTNGPRPAAIANAATNNADPFIVIKGQIVDGDLTRNCSYRFLGRWTTYKNKRTGQVELQFHFESFVETAPLSRAGIIAYLAKQGEGFGIGNSRARRLYESFEQDTLRVCREEPTKAAAAIPGWRPEDAEEFAAQLKRREHLEAVTIELTELLGRRGFPRATAKRAIDLWGNCAAAVIRHDPYKLMQIRGCGFVRCDKLYVEFDLPLNRLKRQVLAAWYALASESEGHVWFPVEFAIRAIQGRVKNSDPAKALRLAKRAGVLSFRRTDKDQFGNDRIVDSGGKLWVAETRRADIEQSIVDAIETAENETTVQWPDVDSLGRIDEHQRAELKIATTKTIGMLGGSPGTGKTFAAASLIQAIIDQHGREVIAVAAPTGKAAVRITESLVAAGIDGITATTIHSLLRVDPIATTSGGGWQFFYRAGRPLPFSFIIIDESSMIDAPLMASLLAARGQNAHLLLVGDVNQLPPVGYGAPLRDFIRAGVPYGELREIKRNSGGIVEACAAIRDAKKWSGGDNLIVMERNPAKVLETIADILAGLKPLDPIWDCQVIVPINTKSELSRRELNKFLQPLLNGENEIISGSLFRMADKVVNTKNGWLLLDKQFNQPCDIAESTNANGEVYVANGEQGKVVGVGEKTLSVELSISKAIVMVPRGRAGDESDATDANEPDDSTNENENNRTNTNCNFELAFAISCHKSQGAEWPVVIIVADPSGSAARVCDRSWWYTAISRAKQRCFIVGPKAVVDKHCRTVGINRRKTFASELIVRNQCERMLREI